MVLAILQLADSASVRIDRNKSDDDGYPFVHVCNGFDGAYNLGINMCKNDANGNSEYLGVTGLLQLGDCAALFCVSAIHSHHLLHNQQSNSVVDFIYAETGSFHGLSAHIVSSGIVYGGVVAGRGLVYSHDLFDLGDSPTMIYGDKNISLWDTLNPLRDTALPLPRFLTFYNNIRRNNLVQFVIPIQGNI